MNSSKRVDRLVRGAAAVALGGLLGLAASQPAHAFSYTSGDVIGVFVDSGAELIVNLGPLAGLGAGGPVTIGLPANFGGDGALGGKFLAFQVASPFTGTLGRNVTFTTENGVDPTTFNSNVVGYVNKIAAAQTFLDDGGGSPDKFLETLPSFPLAGVGGVILNDANRLAILTANAGSYTTKATQGGSTDRINGNLPFEIDNPLDVSSQLIQLWTASRVSTTAASSTLLGSFTVEGNVGGDTARITFAPVPEPGTAFLLASGLAGLVVAGRKRA
jgi:hypothetical protein